MWTDLFLTAVGVLTVTLSLILAATLLLGGPAAHTADRFLAGFLLVSAIDLLGWTAPLMPSAVPPLLVFRLPLAFLQMPFLLAYVLTLGPGHSERRFHLRAGTALVAASALSLTPRALAMAGIDPGLPVSGGADLLWNVAALHLQFYIYAGLIGLKVFSRVTPIVDPAVRRWLRVLLLVSLLAHTLVLAKSAAAAVGAREVYVLLNVAVGANAAAVLISLLMLILLKGRLAAPATPVRPQRVHTASDDGEMVRIREVMTRQQLHRDPQLSLKALARRAGLSARVVSRLINDYEGMHFFDFVNQYRTQSAANLLTDPAWADRSVLEIAYEAGFNSKSSFNAAFRKHQGMTPSSFRRTATGD